MNIEQMQAEIERLKAENNKLAAEKTQVVTGTITIRVGQKGGVCVYGLGRFPVTLFKSQWLRLLDKADDIRKFIDAHPELSEKSKENKAA